MYIDFLNLIKMRETAVFVLLKIHFRVIVNVISGTLIVFYHGMFGEISLFGCDHIISIQKFIMFKRHRVD